jgi:hypothetical protein
MDVIEGQEVVNQPKVGKESVSFRSERPWVGAMGLSREFCEDLVIRCDYRAVGAFRISGAAVRAK